MKSKNPQKPGNNGLINPDSFEKGTKIRKIKRIPRQNNGLVERTEDVILTEDGKELLKEN